MMSLRGSGSVKNTGRLGGVIMVRLLTSTFGYLLLPCYPRVLTYADESVKSATDVQALYDLGVVDGVNVKMEKVPGFCVLCNVLSLRLLIPAGWWLSCGNQRIALGG
jgi:hypothetical protein